MLRYQPQTGNLRRVRVSHFSAETLIAMGVLNKRPKRRALLSAVRARLFGFAVSFEGNERVGVQVENDGFLTWTQTPAVANEVMLSEVQGRHGVSHWTPQFGFAICHRMRMYGAGGPLGVR